MLPLIFIGYGVYQKIQYEYLPIIKQNEISFILVPVVIAALFFYIQKNRLKFVEIKTTKDKSEIDKIIKNTAKKLKWNIVFENPKAIIFKTNPSVLSGSWGEKITILKDNKTVLVNSICDPDAKSSITSNGRNRQNEKTIINEINKPVANITWCVMLDFGER